MASGTGSRTGGTTGGASGRVGVSARRMVGVAAAVGAAVGTVSVVLIPWAITPLVGYDVAAAVYSASHEPAFVNYHALAVNCGLAWADDEPFGIGRYSS